MYSKKELLTKYDDSHDYSFLWRRHDYDEILLEIIKCILEFEIQNEMHSYSYLETFFVLSEDEKDKNLIKEKQDKFIEGMIKKQHQNLSIMKIIFLVIASFEPKRRKGFISLFVTHNKNFEDFKNLSLEPSHRSSSGSWVPVLKDLIDYYESLLPFFNNIDLLEHRQYIESYILRLQKQIEWEKKEDFKDDRL